MKTKLVPKTPKELIVFLYTVGTLISFMLIFDGQMGNTMLEWIVNLMITWSFGMLLLPLV